MKRSLIFIAIVLLLVASSAYAAAPSSSSMSCQQRANEAYQETMHTLTASGDLNTTAFHVRIANAAAHQTLLWCKKH